MATSLFTMTQGLKKVDRSTRPWIRLGWEAVRGGRFGRGSPLPRTGVRLVLGAGPTPPPWAATRPLVHQNPICQARRWRFEPRFRDFTGCEINIFFVELKIMISCLELYFARNDALGTIAHCVRRFVDELMTTDSLSPNWSHAYDKSKRNFFGAAFKRL